MPATHRASRRRIWSMAALAAVAVAALAPGQRTASASSSSELGFGTKIYVDANLAGGEPFVLHPANGKAAPGRLVYTSHEGTTHLFRDGVLTAPKGAGDFVTTYRNQVVIWTSDDNGLTWKRVDWQGTGFFTNPAVNTGFSDPDLTEDAGGTIYNTGIDLANDALFSSPDNGATWPTGTVQCTQGDRPWLAGGKPHQVFLASNVQGGQHTIFESDDSGATCKQLATHPNGDGKLFYDRRTGSLVEPFVSSAGVGVGVMHPGETSFTDHVVSAEGIQSHWPSIAIDRGGNYYLTWDTDNRDLNGTAGCSALPGVAGGATGGPSPLPNSIMLSWSGDGGKTWAKPLTVAHPGTRVLWPWVTAADSGHAAVVWYQYDTLTDPDCGTGDVSIYAATLDTFGRSKGPHVHVTEASHGPIHAGGTCQGGTTCAATGQDRRLGDFFTVATDYRGCLLIASGDTMLTDPVTGMQLPTSRPILIRQNHGDGLAGRDCGTSKKKGSGTAAAGAVLPDIPAAPGTGLLAVAALGGAAVAMARRTRRLQPLPA